MPTIHRLTRRRFFERLLIAAADIASRLNGAEFDDVVCTTLARIVKHLRKNDVDLTKTPLTFGPLLKTASARKVSCGIPTTTTRCKNMLIDRRLYCRARINDKMVHDRYLPKVRFAL